MPHNAASRQSHASRDIVLCNGVMVTPKLYIPSTTNI